MLRERVANVLDEFDGMAEVIYIDDGSTDGGAAVLHRLAGLDGRVCVIRFHRNFGQTAAFSAGFDRARGKVVVTLDANLQKDPADIPRLLAKIDEGYDIVLSNCTKAIPGK